MKILRSHPPHDPCLTSLSLLADKLKSVEFLKGQSFWIPDHPGLFYQDRSKIADIQNIVLFGSFIRRFLESEFWPIEQARLLTTSSAVAEVLEKMLFIPHGHIGVLDRYSIVRKQGPQNPLDLTKPFTFIVSGRMSRSKNLLGVLSFVSFLQTEFSLPARLRFIGDFDEERPDYLGRRVYGDFKNEFYQWMKNLKWTEAPVMTPRLTPDEWPKIDDPQKILMSFSTFHGEDFNMSLAQAQEAGWFGLISDWGGHHEVSGAGIYKIPAPFIPKFSTPLSFQHGQAYGLARAFALKEIAVASLDFINLRDPLRAKEISRSELALARRQAIDYWGMGLLSYLREDIDYFADTSRGAEFFLKYNECFQSPRSFPRHLVFHPHETSSEKVDDQEWEKLGKNQWLDQEEIFFLATTDLNFKDAKLKIANSSRRSFFLSPKNQQIIQDFLKDL